MMTGRSELRAVGFIRDRQRAGIEAAKAKAATSHMHAKSGPPETFPFEKRNNQTSVEL
jgi:hypothetical protein